MGASDPVTEPIWDVLVVGSGPAGASAAIAATWADPSAAVLMLDRQDFPRDKTCGDAILGAAFDRLADFGVDVGALTEGYGPEHHLRLTSAGGATVARPLSDWMTVLPRRVFDARLRAAAVDRGVVTRRVTVRAVHDAGSHVEVEVGATFPLRAKVIVGADGVESVVRRALPKHDRRQLAVALRGYEAGTEDHVSRMVLDDRRGLAYAWRFPSDDGHANVGYGHQLRRGEVSSRGALEEAMHRLLPGLDVDPTTLRAARLPLSTSRAPVARGRVLLAGDAASLVNPLTGEGIYYAIHSGLLAGTAAMHPGGAARRYQDEMAQTFGRHHRHVAVMSALSGRAALLEAGLRAAAADQRVFDDIASLALSRGAFTPRVVRGIAAQLVKSR